MLVRGLYSDGHYMTSTTYDARMDLLGVVLYRGETPATTKRRFVNRFYSDK